MTSYCKDAVVKHIDSKIAASNDRHRRSLSNSSLTAEECYRAAMKCHRATSDDTAFDATRPPSPALTTFSDRSMDTVFDDDRPDLPEHRIINIPGVNGDDCPSLLDLNKLVIGNEPLQENESNPQDATKTKRKPHTHSPAAETKCKLKAMMGAVRKMTDKAKTTICKCFSAICTSSDQFP